MKHAYTPLIVLRFFFFSAINRVTKESGKMCDLWYPYKGTDANATLREYIEYKSVSILRGLRNPRGIRLSTPLLTVPIDSRLERTLFLCCFTRSILIRYSGPVISKPNNIFKSRPSTDLTLIHEITDDEQQQLPIHRQSSVFKCAISN